MLKICGKRSIFIGFSVFVIIVTIIIIATIHNDIKFTRDYLLTPKFHLTTNLKANSAECQQELDFNFKSFMQQGVCPAKDLYPDLQDAIEYMESKESARKMDARTTKVATLSDFFSVGSNENLTVLDKFNLAIKQTELYSENSTLVDELVHDMATRKIVQVYEKSGGTQLKLKIIFDNGMYAIAKPMRFPRDWEVFRNQLQFTEFERHTAEIAAYHLDRILGYRRTMPVVGRILNVTSEIYEIADRNLTKTFFISPEPEKNRCFYGTCRQYCDIDHPICANGDLLETAFIGYLPFYFDDFDIRECVPEYEHPWMRSYSRKRKAIWEYDPKYCDKIKKLDDYKRGRRLLDLMDLCVFDFLTGNTDRHHYAVFEALGGDSFFLNFDNGRAFGRSYYDEILNLLPLSQCCVIRLSTLKTLLRFHNGPKPLSQLMRESMASDPISKNAPVLLESHLEALDRRVNKILSTFRECIKSNAIDDVIYSRDNFGK